MSLIDAYNLIQSDRVNDRKQLVDAILCFYGVKFTEGQMAELRICAGAMMAKYTR